MTLLTLVTSTYQVVLLDEKYLHKRGKCMELLHGVTLLTLVTSTYQVDELDEKYLHKRGKCMELLV